MSAISYPVIALAALTSAVLLRIPYVRFKAGYAGRVKVKDFRYGESGKVPGDVWAGLDVRRAARSAQPHPSSTVVLVVLWVRFALALK